MKRLFYLYCILICLILIGVRADARTFFIAANGSDNNSLTQAQVQSTPWQTPAKLASVAGSLLPGDVIALRSGDVFLGPLPVKSGVSYTSYGTGAAPVVSGFRTLTGWVSEGSGIYSVALNTGFYLSAVLFDGNLQEMGRFPNTGYRTYTAHNGNTSITDNSLTGSWTGAEVVIKKAHWILDRHIITSGNGTTLTYASQSATDLPLKRANNYSPQDGFGYFIQGARSTLDVLGEWWYDRPNNKLYMFFGNGLPTNHTIKASTVEALVDMTSSQDHISFDDITFEGANSYGMKPQSTSNITITNCTFRQMGGYGVWGNGGNTAITMKGCTFSDIANVANFWENANSSLFYGNNFVNIAQHAGMTWSGDANGYGQYIDGNDDIQRRNTFSFIGYAGLFFHGNNITIDSNYISNFANTKDDCGGIYTYRGTTEPLFTNRKVKDNIVINAIGSPQGTSNNRAGAHGIYADGRSQAIDIFNNSISDCATSGIFVNYANSLNIYNNNVYNCAAGQLMFEEEDAGTIHDINVHDNIFTAATATQEVMHISIYNTNIPDYQNFGTFANNYYARPLAQTTIIGLQNGTTNTSYTVANWNTAVGDNSKGSSKTTTTPSDLRYEYNNTTSTKTVTLDAAYSNIPGTSNFTNGTTTVAPFKSVTLIRTGNIVITQPTLGLFIFGKRIIM